MHQDTSYVSRTLTVHCVVQPVSHFSLIIVEVYVNEIPKWMEE